MGFYNESSPPPRRPGLLGPAPPGMVPVQSPPGAGMHGVSEHNDVDMRIMQMPGENFLSDVNSASLTCYLI